MGKPTFIQINQRLMGLTMILNLLLKLVSRLGIDFGMHKRFF